MHFVMLRDAEFNEVLAPFITRREMLALSALGIEIQNKHDNGSLANFLHAKECNCLENVFSAVPCSMIDYAVHDGTDCCAFSRGKTFSNNASCRYAPRNS